MARRYREVRRLSPKKIFLIDFESVWRSEKGLPLCPIEVTVRDGNGDVIISCIINDEGVTNSAFEDALSDLGYSDEKSFQGARRIRGPRQSRTPWNADTTTIQTPKEIVDMLRAAGLDPDCFWIEYSTTLFDYKCMRVLIERAGYSVESILPPPVRCWSVVQDFARSLPGLASYKLGRIVRLMNPKNPNLRYLHYSAPDTAALYDLTLLN